MKSIRILKDLSIIALLGISVQLSAQETITVRISPNSESTIIGKLESASLVVNAEWPDSTEPVPGWKPIYYRGQFRVYLDSQDIGKDYSPLPGSKYLLSPSPDAQVLAVATDEDKAEIVSIDPRYCHINLTTIVLGYILDPTSEVPQQPSPNPPSINSSTVEDQKKPISDGIKSIDGVLVTTNMYESKQSGYSYKIVNDNNETLAFLDATTLPDFVVIQDHLNRRLTAVGTFKEKPGSPHRILAVQSLKPKR